MQKVTSTSEHVALNTTQEVKARFGTYDISWNGVKHPAGNSIIARVANAMVEAVKNLAKFVYNAAIWVPNKIHSLLYPNAHAAAATPAADDEVVIQQDSVIISVYDPAQQADQANAESELPPVIEIEEELPEPVAANGNGSWVKVAAVVTGTAVLTTGLLAAAHHYNVKVPYFQWDVPGAATAHSFVSGAAGYAQNGWNAAASHASNAKNAFCGYTNWCASNAGSGAGGTGGAGAGAGTGSI